MDQDIKNAVTKLREHARRLLTQAEELEKTGELLSDNGDPRHNSLEGRARISEANKRFWVVCTRPECNGVRHRRTHPHIVSVAQRKTKVG